MDKRHGCPWKEQPKHCSVQHRLVEGLEAVPELDGEITLKVLVGLALVSHQSIYLLSQRMLDDRDAWRVQLEHLPTRPTNVGGMSGVPWPSTFFSGGHWGA